MITDESQSHRFGSGYPATLPKAGGDVGDPCRWEARSGSPSACFDPGAPLDQSLRPGPDVSAGFFHLLASASRTPQRFGVAPDSYGAYLEAYLEVVLSPDEAEALSSGERWSIPSMLY